MIATEVIRKDIPPMITVLKAYLSGAVIQARGKPGEGDEYWHDCHCPNWDFYRVEFRVRPWAREFWIVEHPLCGSRMVFDAPFAGPQSIKSEAKQIHVREVLE